MSRPRNYQDRCLDQLCAICRFVIPHFATTNVTNALALLAETKASYHEKIYKQDSTHDKGNCYRRDPAASVFDSFYSDGSSAAISNTTNFTLDVFEELSSLVEDTVITSFTKGRKTIASKK